MAKTKRKHVKVILSERGKTHGKFSDNAVVTQLARAYWRITPNWNNLSHGQRLALDEIALKVARILSEGSDPKLAEHWDDIIGYATLGRQDCDV